MYAVRTIRLCTKDCLCLYVCPTGATDTENSVIDKTRCTGCGACAQACPSKAISMVPEAMPPQQEKAEPVAAALRALAQSKCAQEAAARALPGPLAAALAHSDRYMAEDLLREAGYMLPQGEPAHALLLTLLSRQQPEGFPRESAERLLEILPFPDQTGTPA